MACVSTRGLVMKRGQSELGVALEPAMADKIAWFNTSL
jgi:hypothetical protein